MSKEAHQETELSKAFMELARQSALMNGWLNAEDGPIEWKDQVYRFRNAVEKIKDLVDVFPNKKSNPTPAPAGCCPRLRCAGAEVSKRKTHL